LTRARRIKVDMLARVEGEGGLTVRLKDGRVRELRLDIFEPPRFFEGFLRGRHFREVPDITARICGICPVAYQMSSCHALEAAAGVRVTGPLRDLRRLLYCGEWIESHALHVFLLHAPDFLGYDDAIGMAADHGAVVQKGLRLKKLGNAIVAKLGGREIHPINVCVGGFYRVPRRQELVAFVPELEWAREAAYRTVRWAAGLDFPDFSRDTEFVALRHPDEYPMNEGRLVSSRGLDIDVAEFEAHVVEEQVPYSNALHAAIRGRGAYACGPLARYNLNFDRLSPGARAAAAEAGLPVPCTNPFMSIVVRGVELLCAVEEALRLIAAYTEPDAPRVEVPVPEGTGHGCTEAPRGILYHRYRVGPDGLVREARIVPPTAQNQRSIEEDLLELVPRVADLPLEEATLRCEQAIRNYDPCISCATHFLRLRLERE